MSALTSVLGATAADAIPGAEVTIVLPTLNEQPNIVPMIEKLSVALRQFRWEIIVVDDQSTDGTAELVARIASGDRRIRCLTRIGRRGLAGACIEGALAAQAPIVVVLDADLQHDESIIPALVGEIRDKKADVALGTRYQNSMEIENFGAGRKRLSIIGTRLAKAWLGITASDPLSGFFAIRRDLVAQLAPHLSQDGFKLLLDVLSTRRFDLDVHEVPYEFRPRFRGHSKFDTRVALDFAGLIVGRLTRNMVPPQFVLFCVVGLSGIIPHAIVLFSLLHFGVAFRVAQIAGAMVATACNFWLNNALTYRNEKLEGWRALWGLLLFYLICSFGLASNISVATWLGRSGRSLSTAGILGAIMSAVWNYAVSRTFVWHKTQRRIARRSIVGAKV